VPDTVIKRESVGIGRKSGHRLDMICLPVGRTGNAGVKIPDLLGALKNTITFFSGPFFHIVLL
jgi:hypothetical protein